MNKSKTVENIYKYMPETKGITELDISDTEIRFTWRNKRYCCHVGGAVDEVIDNKLAVTDTSILIEALIKVGNNNIIAC